MLELEGRRSGGWGKDLKLAQAPQDKTNRPHVKRRLERQAEGWARTKGAVCTLACAITSRGMELSGAVP